MCAVAVTVGHVLVSSSPPFFPLRIVRGTATLLSPSCSVRCRRVPPLHNCVGHLLRTASAIFCCTFRFVFNGTPTKLHAFAVCNHRRSDIVVPSCSCVPFARRLCTLSRTRSYLIFNHIFCTIVYNLLCAHLGGGGDKFYNFVVFVFVPPYPFNK